MTPVLRGRAACISAVPGGRMRCTEQRPPRRNRHTRRERAGSGDRQKPVGFLPVRARQCCGTGPACLAGAAPELQDPDPGVSFCVPPEDALRPPGRSSQGPWGFAQTRIDEAWPKPARRSLWTESIRCRYVETRVEPGTSAWKGRFRGPLQLQFPAVAYPLEDAGCRLPVQLFGAVSCADAGEPVPGSQLLGISGG